jgi:ATP-dependent RNA helicase HelY
VTTALDATVRLWSELEADERRHRIERTREPDLGFAWPVYRWASGQSLAAVLTAAEQNGQELSAGDFVRWCRQVIDLLDQIAKVAGPDHGVGKAASEAVRAIRRGVVAVGTV